MCNEKFINVQLNMHPIQLNLYSGNSACMLAKTKTCIVPHVLSGQLKNMYPGQVNMYISQYMFVSEHFGKTVVYVQIKNMFSGQLNMHVGQN